MSAKNKKEVSKKKKYKLKVGYAQFKKGDEIPLSAEGAAYLRSIHKI